MKKALSISMVLLLLLSMAVPASAAGTPTLSISSGEVKAGESITLTVSIKDNPGIAATLLYVYYDEETFSLDMDSDIEVLGKFASKSSFVANSIDNMKKTMTYDGDIGKNGVAVLWFSLSGSDVTTNGSFLQIKLKTSKDAANGEYMIGVGASQKNTQNVDGKVVAMTGSSGSLTVSGGSDEKKPSEDKVVEFGDIAGHWAESYIRLSAELGLVEGYEGLYRPDDTMTRAEFVTILWRSVGEPEPKGKASFTDLKQDWYFKSVAWAEENQIVNGMGDGKFEPTGSVTREQLVTILHRMAGTPVGMELMLTSTYDSQYADSSAIGDWAKSAVYWSIYEGIYCGQNSVEIGDQLAPRAAANRAQIAVMMTHYLNEE